MKKSFYAASFVKGFAINLNAQKKRIQFFTIFSKIGILVRRCNFGSANNVSLALSVMKLLEINFYSVVHVLNIFMNCVEG